MTSLYQAIESLEKQLSDLKEKEDRSEEICKVIESLLRPSFLKQKTNNLLMHLQEDAAFYAEYRTFGLTLPRQSGKTSALIKMLQRDSTAIIVANNEWMKKDLLKVVSDPARVYTISDLAKLLKTQEYLPPAFTIYLDDVTLYEEGFEILVNFAKRVRSKYESEFAHGVQYPRFFFLGTHRNDTRWR